VLFGRRQLPVYSPIDPFSLVVSGVSAIASARESLREDARQAIARHFHAREVTLTDSGTSALVLALRIATQAGGDVAMPAYGCLDLASAAQCADVRVRLYDLNPATLSPDEESVRAACRAGASVIVATHLFGYACDISALRAIATEYGVVLIEDAAQAAGGRLHGRALGSHGDLSVLSFGRGKGTSAGGGGALLTMSPAGADAVRDAGAALPAGGAGLKQMVVSAAVWVLGRPSLYALPSAIPLLRLGEMVYRPAHEPRAMDASTAALVPRALHLSQAAIAGRQRLAERLAAEARTAGLGSPEPIPGSQSGYLRLAVLAPAGAVPDARLGILRPYPTPLEEHEAMRRVLSAGTGDNPEARTLARRLVTVPVHELVTAADERGIVDWMRQSVGGT
jgi:dTDP-4-amino-4,6-dideoxygalactose transaminase